MVIQFLFGDDENVLQFASGNGCPSLNVRKILITYFKMVNLMVNEFYTSVFFGGGGEFFFNLNLIN